MFRSISAKIKLNHQKCFSIKSRLLSDQQFKVNCYFDYFEFKKLLFLIFFFKILSSLKKAKLSNDEIDQIHKANLNPVLKTLYRKPLVIKNGSMQFVFDNENKRYLDMFAGIVTTSVGHCHPLLGNFSIIMNLGFNCKF